MFTVRHRVTNRDIARVSTAREALDAVDQWVAADKVAADRDGRDAMPAPWVWDDHRVSDAAPSGVRVGTWDLRRLAARDEAIWAALDAGLSAETAQRLGQDAELLVGREEKQDERRRAAQGPRVFARWALCL